MKKILFIIPSLGAGGAERVLVDILNRFDYEKYDVSLFVIHYFGPYVSQINENVKVIIYSEGKGGILYRIISRIMRLLRISDYFGKNKTRSVISSSFDTIISFTTNEALYYHSFIFDRANRNVSWVHVDVEKNHNSYPFSSRHAELEAYRQIDSIVFVSNDAQDAFNKVYQELDIPQSVIYNLIDKDAIQDKANQLKLEHGELTVVTVGRLIPVKGFDRLVYVAKKLKNEHIKAQIQILGEGVLKTQLQEMIEREDVEDVVKLLGFQSNPYPYISNADVFVSSSLSEAFPLVVCESLCLGKAIVSTKTTGPIELLADKYGMLVDQSEQALYEGIKKVLTDEKLRHHYEAMALERSKMFMPEETMKAIYKII